MWLYCKRRQIEDMDKGIIPWKQIPMGHDDIDSLTSIDAASLGFTLLVILSAIWGQYIKLRFSGAFYASYDKVGMIVVIAVMAVTAIGCFVRYRLELV